MAEYIECRKCDSPYCDGCNTLTLSKMLHARKFDCLLDEHHCINPCADVGVVKHGRWKLGKGGKGTCDQCHFTQLNVWDYDNWQRYCGCCGAKMEDAYSDG